MPPLLLLLPMRLFLVYGFDDEDDDVAMMISVMVIKAR